MTKPTRDQWTALLTLAGTAPSLFNAQPWRVVVDGEHARVDVDPTRLAPWPLPGLCAGLSMGAFEQALLLGAEALGAHVDVEPAQEGFVARVRFDSRPPDPPLRALLEARRTSRAITPRGGDVSRPSALGDAAQPHGVAVALATAPEVRAALARIIGRGNAHAQQPRALQVGTTRWLRATPEDARARRDGMDLALLAAPPPALALLRGAIAEPDLIVRSVPLEARAAALVAPFEASRAIAVLHTGHTPEDHVAERGRALGRALMSVWIEATRQNLGVQPIAPVLVAAGERADWREAELGPDDEPIHHARTQVRDALGLGTDREPGFALRLHDAVAPAGSLRLPVESFCTFQV